MFVTRVFTVTREEFTFTSDPHKRQEDLCPWAVVLLCYSLAIVTPTGVSDVSE